MAEQLTSTKKWQLALRLLLLYSPLLFYVNFSQTAWQTKAVIPVVPLFLGYSFVVLGLYFIWINATDWIQRQLFTWFGEDFLHEFSWKAILITILVSLGLAFLFMLAFQQVLEFSFRLVFYVWPALQPKNPTLPFPSAVLAYVQRANIGFSIAIMLSAFDLTINARAFQQLKDVQLRAERLEKEAVRSQFDALKNQLSPHFLFNSLSILTSLIHEDVELSEQFIKQLSKAYRYLLEQREQDMVPLKTELDFIQAYTFLLQIRFENKFEVIIDVPESVQNQYRIAPLSLQLVVENAVKHNRMSIRERLQVRIYAKEEFLIIENPLQPRDQPEPSTGVGLTNITNRYTLLTQRPVWYGEQQRFIRRKNPAYCMNVVIIEDEAPTARQLERMLKKYDPTLHVVAQLPSVKEAVAWFSQHGSGQPGSGQPGSGQPPDLVFMDIHLEDGLAFGIFEQIQLTLPIIFTTAYEEYMIRAFKVNSIDYLLKPVDYDELVVALDKFRTLRRQPGLSDLNSLLALIQKPREPDYKERFMVSLGTKIWSVEVGEVAYFFSEEKATFLVTKASQSLPVDYSLDQVAGMLNPTQFFRVNRQFLVARPAIQTIHTYSAGKLKLDLLPSSRHEVFVSLSRITEFKDWLGR